MFKIYYVKNIYKNILHVMTLKSSIFLREIF